MTETALQPVTTVTDFKLYGERLLLPKKCALIFGHIHSHTGIMKFADLCQHFKSTEEAMRQNVSRIRAALKHCNTDKNPEVTLVCAQGFIGFAIEGEEK